MQKRRTSFARREEKSGDLDELDQAEESVFKRVNTVSFIQPAKLSNSFTIDDHLNLSTLDTIMGETTRPSLPTLQLHEELKNDCESPVSKANQRTNRLIFNRVSPI